jgi:hypothetical protein
MHIKPISALSLLLVAGMALPASCATPPEQAPFRQVLQNSAATTAPQTQLQQGGVSVTAPLTQAEQWVQNRNAPWLQSADPATEKKSHKGPVKSLLKGLGKELGASLDAMAKDMVLVFSVQDIDPYEVKSPPTNRPAIILKFNLIDGSSCYLRRFPDNSFAIEDGFADGTVMVPTDKPNEYIIKYPNGAKGRVVRQGTSTVTVYRPDKTVTTVSKTASGGYSVRNDQLGYMGEARPDRTGINYELGQW